jgi:hypothetical protein
VVGALRKCCGVGVSKVWLRDMKQPSLPTWWGQLMAALHRPSGSGVLGQPKVVHPRAARCINYSTTHRSDAACVS